MFDEKLLEAVNEDFTHLNKVMVESTAQTAYNSVVFEAALEDVLAEADDAEAEEKKDADPSKVKNNLYKAWEAVKKFFVSICQKIRVAINEFIAKASQKNFKKAIEDYNKNNADADSRLSLLSSLVLRILWMYSVSLRESVSTFLWAKMLQLRLSLVM